MTQHAAGPDRPRQAHSLVEVDPLPVFDFSGMLRVVWQGKWIIALATILCISAAGYYAFRMLQPRFVATAVLQIDVQPTTLHDVSGMLLTPGSDANSLNTQIAIMTSGHLLGQVVDTLALLDDRELNRYLNPASPFSINALRSTVRNMLAGTTQVPPSTAAIREKTIENLRAVLSVNRPSNTYIFEIQAKSGAPDKAAVIANTLAAVYLADKVAAQNTASQEAEDWLSGRVIALQSQLLLQETEITALLSTAQIQEDTKLDTLSNQVLDIEQELATARAILATLEAQTGTTRQQSTVLQHRTQIDAITSQRDRLLAQLSAQSAGLATLNQMQRQADATRVLYETYLARLQETRIQHGLDAPNSHLVAAATAGTYAGPRKLLILVVSAFVGILLGLTIITLRHTLRKGIFDPTTLQHETGVPVFAQIAASKAHGSRRFAKCLQTRQPIFGNAMQNLRTSLQIAAQGPVPKIILSTSSLPNEDSAAYAAALTQSFAQSGKSVLLIVGHTELTRRAQVTGNDLKIGMGDVLYASASLELAIDHNAFLAADILRIEGEKQQQDAVLADGFNGLLDDLARRYDHIVIDGPPMLSAPQAQLWAQAVDAVIYSVRWSKTPLAAVQSGLRLLADAGSPAAGLILSQVNTRKMPRLGTATPLSNTVPRAT